MPRVPPKKRLNTPSAKICFGGGRPRLSPVTTVAPCRCRVVCLLASTHATYRVCLFAQSFSHPRPPFHHKHAHMHVPVNPTLSLLGTQRPPLPPPGPSPLSLGGASRRPLSPSHPRVLSLARSPGAAPARLLARRRLSSFFLFLGSARSPGRRPKKRRGRRLRRQAGAGAHGGTSPICIIYQQQRQNRRDPPSPSPQSLQMLALLRTRARFASLVLSHSPLPKLPNCIPPIDTHPPSPPSPSR